MFFPPKNFQTTPPASEFPVRGPAPDKGQDLPTAKRGAPAVGAWRPAEQPEPSFEAASRRGPRSSALPPHRPGGQTFRSIGRDRRGVSCRAPRALSLRECIGRTRRCALSKCGRISRHFQDLRGRRLERAAEEYRPRPPRPPAQLPPPADKETLHRPCPLRR